MLFLQANDLGYGVNFEHSSDEDGNGKPLRETKGLVLQSPKRKPVNRRLNFDEAERVEATVNPLLYADMSTMHYAVKLSGPRVCAVAQEPASSSKPATKQRNFPEASIHDISMHGHARGDIMTCVHAMNS